MASAVGRGLERDAPVELQAVGHRRRNLLLNRIVLYVVLTVLALFFIMPLVIILSTALKGSNPEVFGDPGLIPREPGLENFQSLLSGNSAFFRWFINSAIVAVTGTLLTLIITSLSAYAFARIDFKGKNTLFSLLIATLLLPGVMFLVPQSQLIGAIGLYDSLPAFALPHLAGVFGVFFMRQFFLGIPVELEEAAYVDGANRLKTFWSVILPLAGPALATLAVITFLAYWNDYLWPLVVCQTNCTLPPGLRLLQGQYTAEYGLLMAGAVIAAVPVLIVYVLAQKWIVQSVTSSGVKG